MAKVRRRAERAAAAGSHATDGRRASPAAVRPAAACDRLPGAPPQCTFTGTCEAIWTPLASAPVTTSSVVVRVSSPASMSAWRAKRSVMVADHDLRSHAHGRGVRRRESGRRGARPDRVLAAGEEARGQNERQRAARGMQSHGHHRRRQFPRRHRARRFGRGAARKVLLRDRSGTADWTMTSARAWPKPAWAAPWRARLYPDACTRAANSNSNSNSNSALISRCRWASSRAGSGRACGRWATRPVHLARSPDRRRASAGPPRP